MSLEQTQGHWNSCIEILAKSLEQPHCLLDKVFFLWNIRIELLTMSLEQTQCHWYNRLKPLARSLEQPHIELLTRSLEQLHCVLYKVIGKLEQPH